MWILVIPTSKIFCCQISEGVSIRVSVSGSCRVEVGVYDKMAQP